MISRNGPDNNFKGQQVGGTSANTIRGEVEAGTDLVGKFQWRKEGLVASDIAFKGTPGLQNIFGMLDVRHASSVVNINGRLWDSAKDINLFSPTKGVFYASPWVGTCHQAMYDTIMAGGMSSTEALGVASSQAGWSFYITTSLYGVNGGYGMSGIANAGVNQHDKK